MRFYLAFFILGIFITASTIPPSYAQFQQGGVDHPGEWWVGEGLEQGDFFSYRLCFVHYKDCTAFKMDFWIQGEEIIDDEKKWMAKTVVYDGNKILVGDMHLGKLIPEPTGGTKDLKPYISAFKSSIVWLSAYATQDFGDLQGKGPKKFSQVSWGKIANIGGEQIIPIDIQSISVPFGDFETVLLTWKTGGMVSKVWVLDEFPFPIKANTWVHVPTGIAPPEYRFELLDHEKNIPFPFEGVEPTPLDFTDGCETFGDFKKVVQNTNTFSMVIEVTYKPANPISGCNIEWLINFKRISYPTEFENNVHYDILVVDENNALLRSLAEDEGHPELFTTFGQASRITKIEEPDGIIRYAILVLGSGPENIVANPEKFGWINIDIPISANEMNETNDLLIIPDWIKQNAAWWCQDQIAETDFSSGIEFMIKTGIINFPEVKFEKSNNTQIPDWVKNNACWWSGDIIGDEEFANGISHLIKTGIISI